MSKDSESADRVFVSHSSRDWPIAMQIVHALEEANVRCWIAPRDIIPGSDYNAAITAGVRASNAMLFIESRHSMESDQVIREIDAAANRRIPIIPVRLETIERSEAIAHLLRTYQWIDAFPPPVDRYFESIIDGVQLALKLQPSRSFDGEDAQQKYIGPYRIMNLLGEGGMGGVYLAEQRSPIRRMVALKRIKAGLDTKDVLARFESERQALARMDHPNIAKVFDGGADERGRPYFVMEYVPGKPITEYADENKLSIEDRLKLFTQACEAIAHAHTKAIIHRDVKSSNVLAFTFEGRPVVKVIDFGIAKALTSDRLTDRSYATAHGFAIGTYEYMSPEQAEGSPDIDTRTDVYSLGVLLYELLSGAKPFDSKTLGEAADAEARRIIREVEPPRPSTRLTATDDSGTKAAADRSLPLHDLTKKLRSELEWIPLKAMRKQRERRYESPLELVQDIDNYLNNRPLKAGPESMLYRAQKAIRRNRMSFLISGAALLIAAASIGFYVQSIRTEQIRTAKALERVVAEQKQKEQALASAKEQSELATQRLNEKRVALDEMLSSFSDENLRAQPGSQPIRQSFLERGLAQYQLLLADNANDVDVVLKTAETLRELATLHRAMGNAEQELARLNESLGLIRGTLKNIQNVRLNQALGETLKALAESLVGHDHIAEGVSHAKEGAELMERIVAEDPNNPKYKAMLGTFLMLGSFSRPKGDGGHPNDDRAVELLRQAVQAIPEDADIRSQLGRAVNSRVVLKFGDENNEETQSAVQEAIQLQDDAIRLRPTFAEAHVRRVRFVLNAAFGYRQRSQPDQALEILEQAIATTGRFNAENPSVILGQTAMITLQNDKAFTLKLQGKMDEAIKAYQEAIKIGELLMQREPKAESHVRNNLETILAIGEIHRSLGRSAEEVATYEAYTNRAAELMLLHPASNRIMRDLLGLHIYQGYALESADRKQEARTVFQGGLDLYAKHSSLLDKEDEDISYNLLSCCFGLESIARSQRNLPMAVQVLEKHLLPIDMSKARQSQFKSFALPKRDLLAKHYEALGLDQKALDLRIANIRLAQSIEQQHPELRFQCRQLIMESYEPIAKLYRKKGDSRRAYSALRKYFSETDTYIWGRDNSKLLDELATFSEENSQRLWQAYERATVTRVKVNMQVSDTLDGLTQKYDLVVTDSWGYVEDQFEQFRQGKPEGFLRDDYEFLQQVRGIAQKHNASFASAVSLVEKPRENEEMLACAKEIERLRRDLLDQPNRSLLRLQIAEQLIELSRLVDAGIPTPAALVCVDEAVAEAEQCQAAGLHEEERINLVFAQADLARSRSHLRQGRNQTGYEELIRLIPKVATQSSKAKAVLGEVFYELGNAATQLDRKFEAAGWYIRSAEMGFPKGLEALVIQVNLDESLQQVLPPALREIMDKSPLNGQAPAYEVLSKVWDQYSKAIKIAESEKPKPKLSLLATDPLTSELRALVDDMPTVILMRGKNIYGLTVYCYLKCTGEQSKRLFEAIDGDATFNISDYGVVIAAGRGDPPEDIKREVAAKFRKVVTSSFPGQPKPIKSDDMTWEEFLKATPSTELPSRLSERATSFSKKGKLEEVLRCADKMRELANGDSLVLYNSACAYALCAQLRQTATSNPSSPSPEQEQLIESSLACLREAIASSTDFNYGKMAGDADLTILRELPAFKKLFPNGLFRP